MKNELYFNKKAEYFEEALPVGNGRIGGLVFGNLKKERIALNEDSLWSGYPKDRNKKDAHKYLDNVRNAIFSKDYKKAKRILNEDMHGHWSESYLPFGDLIIDYGQSRGIDYQRRLDISKGVAKVSNSYITQTVFVSHPAQMMVVNIKSNSPHSVSCSIRFDSKLKHRCYTQEDSLIIEGDAPEICMPPYYNKGKVFEYGEGAMHFCGAVKVLGNAIFEKDSISVKAQEEITLLISLATSFVDFKLMPNADAKARALSYFKNTKSYERLLTEHILDFSALFDRVDFTLEGSRDDLPTNKRIKRIKNKDDDNALIALLFQYGRYLTISGSRKGTNAMNLQGIWNTHLRAPWSSNYTTNINTQMNYWCTDIANLSECFEPLFELAKKLAYNGRTTARDYYNCSGSCSHHNSDIWGASYPAGFPDGDGDACQYAPWSTSLPWILNQLYEHYLYTNDEAFKAEIMPLYKDCLDFYKDFLITHNGELVTCPSISPENNYNDNGRVLAPTYMPSMDREILFDFFENCKELGFDNVPVIEQVKVASDGRIPEWAEAFEETEIEHRHVSHLYCIYPSRFIQSDELNKACEKSLNVRGFGGTGWSLGWKVCLWARLNNAENALRLIKQQLTYISPRVKIHSGGGSYPNLFDAHPPFQIDGNFGVCAGIAEMLKNKALPSSWSGEIRGIKTYGGEEISYSFKNGKVI